MKGQTSSQPNREQTLHSFELDESHNLTKIFPEKVSISQRKTTRREMVKIVVE